MIDTLAYSPFGFWIVAVLIILIDATVFLQPGRFTFRIGRGLTARIRVVETPFLLLGREPVVTLISYPFSAFFITSDDGSPKPRSALKRDLLALKRLARACEMLATLALTSGALVCVAGPILSAQYSVGHGIIFVMPVVYILAVLGISLLCAYRSNLGLARSDVAGIGFELLLCPFLMVNVIKKVVVRQKIAMSVQALVENFVSDKDETTRKMSAHLEATR